MVRGLLCIKHFCVSSDKRLLARSRLCTGRRYTPQLAANASPWGRAGTSRQILQAKSPAGQWMAGALAVLLTRLRNCFKIYSDRNAAFPSKPESLRGRYASKGLLEEKADA